VLVADNGSTDGSQELAKMAGARIVNIEQKGYGAALLGGIQAAKGKYIAMGDADDSYDFTGLEPFLSALRGGAQLVMGNRFKGGIAPGAMPPLHRWLGNPVLSALGRLFFRLPVGDFHCGLRAFDAQAVRDLHLTAPGMEFATEMIAKASFAGLRVEEVPTTLKPDGRGRPPHLRTWRDGWRHLRFMLLFSPEWLFLLPGGILLLLSLLGISVLWKGPFHIGSIGFDIHTMLYCSAGTALGLLAIQWGAMLQWLGITSGMRINPENHWAKILEKMTIAEIGIFIGLSLFIPGIYWSFTLAGHWYMHNFGEISNPQVLRDVIAACTLLVVGAQIIGGSLFSAALKASIDSGFIKIR
jgi:glycosyltransferase involved in cell wall biosynthesis